jgi:hypothetical protein
LHGERISVLTGVTEKDEMRPKSKLETSEVPEIGLRVKKS